MKSPDEVQQGYIDRLNAAGGAFEQFDFGLTHFEESGAHFLVCYFFNSETFQTKHFFVEGDCFVEAGHGDADVFNMGNFHNCLFIRLLVNILSVVRYYL